MTTPRFAENFHFPDEQESENVRRAVAARCTICKGAGYLETPPQRVDGIPIPPGMLLGQRESCKCQLWAQAHTNLIFGGFPAHYIIKHTLAEVATDTATSALSVMSQRALAEYLDHILEARKSGAGLIVHSNGATGGVGRTALATLIAAAHHVSYDGQAPPLYIQRYFTFAALLERAGYGASGYEIVQHGRNTDELMNLLDVDVLVVDDITTGAVDLIRAPSAAERVAEAQARFTAAIRQRRVAQRPTILVLAMPLSEFFLRFPEPLLREVYLALEIVRPTSFWAESQQPVWKR